MTYRRKQFDVPSELPKPVLDLAKFVNGEFQKLEVESTRPEVRGMSFEVQQTLPARYKEGDLYYGAAGVFGGAAGIYIREGANWRKL